MPALIMHERIPTAAMVAVVPIKRAGKSTMSPERTERIRQAVRERLMPRYDNNQSKLAPALGIEQSALSRFLSGGGTSMETALVVAQLLGTSLDDLFGDPPDSNAARAAIRFRDLPGWAEAEREARARYAEKIPDWAFKRAGDLMGAGVPIVDAATVARFAESWWLSSKEDDKAKAWGQEMDKEMAAEDEAEALKEAQKKRQVAAAEARGELTPPAPKVLRKGK